MFVGSCRHSKTHTPSKPKYPFAQALLKIQLFSFTFPQNLFLKVKRVSDKNQDNLEADGIQLCPPTNSVPGTDFNTPLEMDIETELLELFRDPVRFWSEGQLLGCPVGARAIPLPHTYTTFVQNLHNTLTFRIGGFKGVVLKVCPRTSPPVLWNLLEMNILWPTIVKSETLGIGPSNLVFKYPSYHSDVNMLEFACKT